MNFNTFAQFLSELENISSRTQMTTITADFLKQLDSTSVKPAMYLLQGRLAPKYIPIEFNFSLKLIIKSLSQIIEEQIILDLYKSKGGVGLMVEEILTNWNKYVEQQNKLDLINFEYKPANKNIEDVFKDLELIANSSGSGSQEKKMSTYLNLILSVDSLSAKYISFSMDILLRLKKKKKNS